MKHFDSIFDEYTAVMSKAHELLDEMSNVAWVDNDNVDPEQVPSKMDMEILKTDVLILQDSVAELQAAFDTANTATN